ncbi:MAG: cytochrome C [Chitinophagaceae bacterium]|nr:MAG: cytochrome C [Chitinophagaceae bacterium]
MKKVLKWIAIVLLTAIVLVQFVPRPAKNESSEVGEAHISKVVEVSPEVSRILDVACMDCHSNNTKYPWYSRIQPVAWWLGDHIVEGKKELNFSEFGNYNAKRQQKKWKETAKQVRDKEMPLKSYTYTHPGARLSAEERELLISWAESHLRP